jgi:hypothetical protein
MKKFFGKRNIMKNSKNIVTSREDENKEIGFFYTRLSREQFWHQHPPPNVYGALQENKI